MEAFHKVLEQLYKKVLLGATLENDSHNFVFYLTPALPDPHFSTASSLGGLNTTGVQGSHKPSSVEVTTVPDSLLCVERSSELSCVREVKLLQLTVIRVMITRILSVETESHAKEKYRDIIKILLQTTEVDSKLVNNFFQRFRYLKVLKT
jgi:hypothetical protein